MANARIIYDTGCPVCTYFMKLVRNKIGSNGIEYLPSPESSTDFEYVSPDGKSYLGTKAIDKMASDFPSIKDYMWALPAKYKTAGLRVAYKVGSVVRKAIGVVKKGCNCGKH